MDTLYYSQYCKNCQKILQFIVKNNLVSKINCICIDKREINRANNTTYIILENGKKIILPQEITVVPSLISKNKIINGDNIIGHYSPTTITEPVSYSSGGFSEKYTNYNINPVELSSNGINRNLNGFVSANHTLSVIPTPENNYKPDKVSQDVSIDKLQQIRNKEIPQNQQLQINNSNLLT
jgi:hypothetical protein